MNSRLLGIVLICHVACAQIITTVAGGDWSFPSGSIPAVNAPLGFLSGVAVDATGNVFVADQSNNMVLRIATDGTLTIAAGNGIAGFSGDGGRATNASLDPLTPGGVAVDSAGSLYIADSGNNRIRKVSNGTITTVAGNGDFDFSGDGGPATSASLNFPQAVAVDSAGNLYIADTYNNRIRKVSNGIITTVAGNGTEGFSGDGGPATSASLDFPVGVAVDLAGNIYIPDAVNNRIRRVSNGTIATVAGSGRVYGDFGDGGPATSALLDFPQGVAVDSIGNLYIVDTLDEAIRKVANGIITTVAGTGGIGFTGDGGPATAASFALGFGVAVDPSGNVYIADAYNGRVRKISGGVIDTIAGNGHYRFSGDQGPATTASLNIELGGGVAVDSDGSVYIADSNDFRIRKVSNGIITTVAGNGDEGFSGDGGLATNASLDLFYEGAVAVDPVGNIYIADAHNNRIRKVSNGIITTVAGNGDAAFLGDGGPATNASLHGPSGIAVDAAGNLYIADTDNDRIRQVANGIITTVAGNGQGGFSGDGRPATSSSLEGPEGVAVDLGGNLYIADTGNNRIRKVTNGIVTTVAGSGTAGFSGDGGPATSVLS